MREIKFRWWDFAGNEMLSENDIDNETVDRGEDGYFHFLKVARYHPMQYTGLRDSRGNEIYECDIVRVTLVDGEEAFKVYYETNKARFSFKDVNGDDWGFAHSNEMEVIGNIYENRELLNA